MRSTFRSCISVLSAVGIIIVPLAEAASQETGPAQAKSGKPKGKKPDAAEAAGEQPRDPAKSQRSYDTGLTAYQAGRYDEAIAAFNVAVQAGGLAGPALAKTLYYRGAAFQAKGMPGQAISDLTSALWLKGGLDDKERAEATRVRAEAYRAAGFADQGGSGSTAWAASGSSTQTINVGPTGSTAASPQLSALPTETSASGGVPDIGSMLGGIFGGLTQGAKTVETAAIPPSRGSSGSSAANGPEVLPWGTVAAPVAPILPDRRQADSAEADVPAAPKPAAKPSAAAKTPKVAAAAGGATGGASGAFSIQVASVKSADEANALASRVKSNASLGGAGVSIDQTAFGGTTFYRVRVGPFASAGDTQTPCQSLKQSGLDCLVITQ